MKSTLELLAWLKELNGAHDRSLDYLIESWRTKDKYDKQIFKIKYQEWHDKYVKILRKVNLS